MAADVIPWQRRQPAQVHDPRWNVLLLELLLGMEAHVKPVGVAEDGEAVVFLGVVDPALSQLD